jgi:hypothetical protein
MQFRGTTEGALTPRYLRILLKKIWNNLMNTL